MLKLLLIAQAAFTFSLYEDAFTDEQVFRATTGNVEDGPGVMIQCEPSEYDKWSVWFATGRTLKNPFMGIDPVLVRFDEDEPQTLVARYEITDAVLEGDDAEAFARSAVKADRVVVGIKGSAKRIDMNFPLSGLSQAIAQFPEACALR